jgi:hypothetical protein
VLGGPLDEATGRAAGDLLDRRGHFGHPRRRGRPHADHELDAVLRPAPRSPLRTRLVRGEFLETDRLDLLGRRQRLRPGHHVRQAGVAAVDQHGPLQVAHRHGLLDRALAGAQDGGPTRPGRRRQRHDLRAGRQEALSLRPW